MTTAQIDYELAMASEDLPMLPTAAREYLRTLSPVTDASKYAEVRGVVELLKVTGR